MSTPPLLTVLLPVRNGAEDLPGFLASARRYADAVVALDDGSTDDTLAMLRADPLVKVIVEKPRRRSFAGWDDAANRNATLEAAAQLDPRWLISVDADERVDEGDSAALREFLETDALPGLAYSFQHFSMQGDRGRYVPTALWVHRLFHHEPGQRFPARRLHFAPIPTSIPRSAYVRTTLRIQHLGGMSPERRRARYEKYRQADPDCRFWPDYTTLLRETPDDELADWEPRAPGAPVLAVSTDLDPTAEAAEVSMTVVAPAGHPSFGTPADAEWLASEADDPLLDRDLVARATGTVILALPRGLVPEEGALERLRADHAAGYALVAPAIEAPPGDGWAARLLERRFAPTVELPAGALLDLPPVWCSLRRDLLLETLGESPPTTTLALQHRLHRNGYLCLQSEARFRAEPPSTAPDLRAVAAAFAAGREGESSILDAHRLRGRRLRPKRRVAGARSSFTVDRSEPLPLPLQVARAAGAVYELVRPAGGKMSTLLGATQLTALWIVSGGGRRRLMVVSWSKARGSVRVLHLPEGLEVERPDGTWVRLGAAIPADGRIRRFVLHELVGRPFSAPVESYVRLDLGEDEPPATGFRATVLPALRQVRTLGTSLDRPSLALFLVEALRAPVEELAPWPEDAPGRLDADAAELAARLFAGHTERDLGSTWERQRLVAWA